MTDTLDLLHLFMGLLKMYYSNVRSYTLKRIFEKKLLLFNLLFCAMCHREDSVKVTTKMPVKMKCLIYEQKILNCLFKNVVYDNKFYKCRYYSNKKCICETHVKVKNRQQNRNVQVGRRQSKIGLHFETNHLSTLKMCDILISDMGPP